jgi:hypothetical protein
MYIIWLFAFCLFTFMAVVSFIADWAVWGKVFLTAIPVLMLVLLGIVKYDEVKNK